MKERGRKRGREGGEEGREGKRGRKRGMEGECKNVWKWSCDHVTTSNDTDYNNSQLVKNVAAVLTDVAPFIPILPL